MKGLHWELIGLTYPCGCMAVWEEGSEWESGKVKATAPVEIVWRCSEHLAESER